jgi:NADH-quinone oxidoreductase subunit J
MQRPAAITLGLILVVMIGIILTRTIFKGAEGEYTTEVMDQIGNTQLVGKMLFTKYVLPFEIASILLFAAIVGAIVLAKKQILKEKES